MLVCHGDYKDLNIIHGVNCCGDAEENRTLLPYWERFCSGGIDLVPCVSEDECNGHVVIVVRHILNEYCYCTHYYVYPGYDVASRCERVSAKNMRTFVSRDKDVLVLEETCASVAVPNSLEEIREFCLRRLEECFTQGLENDFFISCKDRNKAEFDRKKEHMILEFQRLIEHWKQKKSMRWFSEIF